MDQGVQREILGTTSLTCNSTFDQYTSTQRNQSWSTLGTSAQASNAQGRISPGLSESPPARPRANECLQKQPMTSDSGLNTAAGHIAPAVHPSNPKSFSLHTVSKPNQRVPSHIRAALADIRCLTRGEFQQSCKI